MIIRKMFSFEGAHIVRHCTTQRCALSIHGHSYKVEILLEADTLDHGQMILDFGLMKTHMREIIDAFDHTLVYWNDDDPEYINSCTQHSLRWIGLPVSPSAEQLSRVFYVLIEMALDRLELLNGEGDVSLNSVIVHETATGYAQCFDKDAHNPRMGIIRLEDIRFSDQVIRELTTDILSLNEQSI